MHKPIVGYYLALALLIVIIAQLAFDQIRRLENQIQSEAYFYEPSLYLMGETNNLGTAWVLEAEYLLCARETNITLDVASNPDEQQPRFISIINPDNNTERTFDNLTGDYTVIELSPQECIDFNGSKGLVTVSPQTAARYAIYDQNGNVILEPNAQLNLHFELPTGRHFCALGNPLTIEFSPATHLPYTDSQGGQHLGQKTIFLPQYRCMQLSTGGVVSFNTVERVYFVTQQRSAED